MSGSRLALAALLALPPLLAHAAEPVPVRAAASATDPVSSPADTGRAAGGGQPVVPYQVEMDRADSLLKLRGGVHAEYAQLYMAWNAPWGTPGASRVRMPACDDTAGCDTLFLSFFPGRPSNGFNGVSADLVFHATGQDTLGPWWHMEGAGENPGDIRVDWGPARDIPGRQPWTRPGRGFALVERTPTTMRLRLLYGIPYGQGAPIDSGTVYTACRLLIRHQQSGSLRGCGQPVCVEWEKASFAFALRDEPEVRRGERFVSYAAPFTACEPYRTSIARAWKPKGAGGH